MADELALNRAKGRTRRIKALIIKECFQILRDPFSILLSIILPLMLLFIYGYGVSLDLDHLKIGLVLEDTSPDAQSFAKALTNSRFLDVKISRERNQLDSELVKGNIRGIVVVPSYFTEFRNRKDYIAPIQVIADGSETNTANFVQNYVRGAWQTWLAEQHISEDLKGLALVNALPRFWYNEELESRNFLVPGSIAIIMALIGTLLTGLVVAREWERGTMEALMSTPVTISEILIGKLVPYFFMALMTMAMCVVVAVSVYSIPLRGSLWLLFLVTSCFLFYSLAVGLFISSLARNQFLAAQISFVAAFLPSFILSGFIFEIASMPTWIRMITYLIPARYFVSALLTLFLVGNVWKLIIISIIPMLALGLLLFLVMQKIVVKRLD